MWQQQLFFTEKRNRYSNTWFITIILNNTNCGIWGFESYYIKNSIPLGYGKICTRVSVITLGEACHLHFQFSQICLEYTELKAEIYS